MAVKFENILLAIDNSSASKIALQKTCDLATKFNSKITALFVSSAKRIDFSTSKKFLEDFASSKNISLEIFTKKGSLYDEIIKLEKSSKFSHILVGVQSVSGWKSMMGAGSAIKVIQNVSCPVITFKEESQVLDLNSILLPMADSKETRQKVPYCAELAKAFGATVHIYGISNTNKDEAKSHINSYIRQTERYLAERGIKYTVNSIFGVNISQMSSSAH